MAGGSSSSMEEFSTIFSTRTWYDTRLALQFHHTEILLQKTDARRRKIETAEKIPENLAGKQSIETTAVITKYIECTSVHDKIQNG